MIPTFVPAICTDVEWKAATDAGLQIRTLTQEESVHNFAAAIRAKEAAKSDALVKAVKGLIRKGHLLNSSSQEWNAVHAALEGMEAAK